MAKVLPMPQQLILPQLPYHQISRPVESAARTVLGVGMTHGVIQPDPVQDQAVVPVH